MSRALSDSVLAEIRRRERSSGRATWGEFILALALMVPAILVRGWAVSLLWAWFLVPVVEVRAISLFEAYGLTLLVSAITPRDSYGRQADKLVPSVPGDTVAAFLSAIVVTLLCVGIGYVVRFWIL